MSSTQALNVDYLSVFVQAPDLYLLLTPDFVILEASNSYLQATLTTREKAVGKNIFKVFPDNPDDPEADGVRNLTASLNIVLATSRRHEMAIQKYDVRGLDGNFELKYWKPVNTPVLDSQGRPVYIIHKVDDVTAEVLRDEELSMQKIQNEALVRANEQQSKSLKVSEDRFQKVFEFSPVALCITSFEDGVFLHVNNAFAELVGFKPKDIIGRTSVEMGIISDRQRLELSAAVLQHHGSIKNGELEIKNSSDQVVKVLGSIDLSTFNDEKCFLIALMNITDRKEMELSLKQTNHFLDTILENIPNMVFVKDAKDLTYLRINSATEKMTGKSRAELIGKTDAQIFNNKATSYAETEDEDLIRTGKPVDREKRIETTTGPRWLHVRKLPVYEQGEAVYLMGIFEDITQHRLQQDSILELNRELESFSYSVSHDLRAPLRAIAGFTDILLSDYTHSLDEKGRSYLQKVSRNAIKMGKLIDDLLAFSRLGRKDIGTTDTNMEDLAMKAIRELGRNSENKATFKVAALHRAKVDPSMMMQVFLNLISNAIKYSAIVPYPVIAITSVQHSGEVEYCVRDNGAGFDMKYVDKLFGVFQRLHRADEFEGQGVGLAIVARIIKKHGGRVWAEGSINEGAAFYFTVPVS